MVCRALKVCIGTRGRLVHHVPAYESHAGSLHDNDLMLDHIINTLSS